MFEINPSFIASYNSTPEHVIFRIIQQFLANCFSPLCLLPRKLIADKSGFRICKTKFVRVSNNGWLRCPKLTSHYASASVWLLLNNLQQSFIYRNWWPARTWFVFKTGVAFIESMKPFCCGSFRDYPRTFNFAYLPGCCTQTLSPIMTQDTANYDFFVRHFVGFYQK